MEKNTIKDNHDKVITELTDYDSNPFTISFRGFGLIATYAKSVLITLIVMSFLGFIGNGFSQLIGLIPKTLNENNNSSTMINAEKVSARSSSSQGQGDQELNISETLIDGAQLGSNRGINTKTTDDEIKFNPGIIAAIVFGVVVVIIVMIFIGLLISAAIGGFTAAGAVAASQKRNISFNEAFSEMTSKYATLLLAQIIAMLKIVGGYLLLIVPGVRATLRYSALPYIIMRDKNLNATQAIKKSKELYNGHLMEVYGINFVGSIIPIVGSVISAGGMALSVDQIAAYSAANKPTPKSHWLNYLGLIIIGAVALLVLTVTLIIILFVVSK